MIYQELKKFGQGNSIKDLLMSSMGFQLRTTIGENTKSGSIRFKKILMQHLIRNQFYRRSKSMMSCMALLIIKLLLREKEPRQMAKSNRWIIHKWGINKREASGVLQVNLEWLQVQELRIQDKMLKFTMNSLSYKRKVWVLVIQPWGTNLSNKCNRCTRLLKAAREKSQILKHQFLFWSLLQET